MILPDGFCKSGGIDVSKMKADDMRAALQEIHDFKYEN